MFSHIKIRSSRTAAYQTITSQLYNTISRLSDTSNYCLLNERRTRASRVTHDGENVFVCKQTALLT